MTGAAVPPAHEVRGWARLIAGVADRAIVNTAQDVHRAVSDGVYRWIGPVGRPVQAVQDGVTDRVYAAVRAGVWGAGELAAHAAGHLASADVEPSPAAVKARAIAHGVLSEDALASAPELDLEVTVRHGGRELPVRDDTLRAAYPDAGERITVFVHGLVDSEAVWWARNRDGGDDDGVALPDLAAAAGTTPVLVRYGTGRAIGRNGRDLAHLLEELVTAWPVPVAELVIVGHSMGGLVARAACATAAERDHGWLTPLSDVVYLGSPHLGSWLEKVSNVGTWVLRRTSHAAPFGRLIDGRSRGIKDLRWGTLVEHGWGDDPIDDLLTGLVPDEPWAEGVTHHLVVGRLRAAQRHPLNVVFGDTLVRAGSASGLGRDRRIAAGGDVVVVPVVARHRELVRSRDVATLLGGVLGRDPAGRSAAATG